MAARTQDGAHRDSTAQGSSPPRDSDTTPDNRTPDAGAMEQATPSTGEPMTRPPREVQAGDAAAGLRGRTGYRLIKLGELAMRVAESALVPLGVRPRHFHVLATLAADATLSQQEASRLLGIDPNVMVGLIDDLEKLDLARRRRNPEDRRRHVIGLTDAGHRLLAEGAQLLDEAEQAFLAPLSDEELGQLRSAAERLLGRNAGPPTC